MKINSVAPSTSSVESVLGKPLQKTEKTERIDNQQEDVNKLQTINEEAERELTKEDAEHVVNGMNEFLKPHYTSVQFKMHDDLGRYYVEVVDKETDKIVREIPAKELLDMYAKMTDFLGLFIDRKL